MKKLLLLFAFAGLFAQNASAQNHCDRWYIDANYAFLKPLQEFKTGGYHHANGGSMAGYYALIPHYQNVAFHTGFRLNAFIGKNQKDRITLADPEGARAKTRVYNGLVDLEVLARIIALPDSKISPYFEGFGGVRLSAGHERLNLIGNYAGYEDVTSTQVVSNLNWVLGGGAGLLIKLNDVLDLDLRASLDYSPKLKYIDINSYEKVEDNLVYDFSTTEALDYNLRIGIRVKIGCDNESSSRRSYENDNYTPQRQRTRTKRTPQKRTPSSKTKSRSNS